MPTVPDIHRRGTRAAQPAATAVTVGTLYFVTDEDVTERSNGTTWDSYSGAAGAAALDDLTDVTISTPASGQVLKYSGSAWGNASGGGDVTGPASAVDAEVALFDSTTGKLLKRATGTGPAKLTSGVLSAAAIDLSGSEVTSDLPLSKLAQASAASRLLGRGSASGAGDYQEISLGSGLSLSGTTLAAATRTGLIGLIIDGGGSAITTGVKGFLSVPFACTITGWTLLSTDASATSGSIVIDLWKDTYANYPPAVGDTITASAKPTLSSANKNADTTLTGWTTSLSAGDVLGFNVDSATTVTRVALSLTVTVP